VDDIAAKPNFFIVGAPKSGTTAFYTSLSEHPDIGMSRVKEPGFFAADILAGQRRATTLEQYLKNFAHANGKSQIGEASPMYLASRKAPIQIAEFNRNARIIVILRNPIDVMESLHSQRLFSGTEHITRFEEAIDSEETRCWRSGRLRGEPILRLGYREAARFSEQVQRYFEVFGRERVQVILFEEFAGAPRAAYENVLSFLGVQSDGRRNFQIVNASKRVRSRALQSTLRQIAVACRLDCLAPTLYQEMGACITRINSAYRPRPLMTSELRRRLAKQYQPEVEKLGRLLGKDLNHWVSCSSSALKTE
jgi:hypothetical protein